MICGVSPAKIYFCHEPWFKTERKFTDGPAGVVENEVTGQGLRWNQPRFAPILAEDFMWDPSASYWDQVGFCFYRTYQLPEQLRYMQRLGVYRNVDQTSESRSPGKPTSTGIQLDTSGRVEVIEMWERDRLITVANRTVVLQDEPNPYWHGQLPFVLGTLVHDLYDVGGVSMVEQLTPMYEMVVNLMNQRMDGTRLALNPGWKVLDTSGRPGQILRRRPGQRLLVGAMDEIAPLEVDTSWIAPAITSEEKLLEQMNDVSGANPYLSGAATSNVNAATATEITQFQAAAVKRVEMMRDTAIAYPLQRAGQMEIELNQQFLRQPDVVRIDTALGSDYKPYTPQTLTGDFEFVIDDPDQELDRTKSRDSAIALYNQVMTQAPILLQLGVKPRGEAFLKDLLTSFDKDDPESYYEAAPPPAPPEAQGQGPGLPGGGPMGPLSGPPGGAALPPPAPGGLPAPPLGGIPGPGASIGGGGQGRPVLPFRSTG
jgi:hypothetical protein